MTLMDQATSVRRALAAALLALACASCARFVPAEGDPRDLPFPSEFTLYDGTTPAPDRWWEAFSSDEVDGLVTQALEGNLTLQQVYARLTQAEMLARQAGTSRYPELNVTGDVSATRRRTDTGESVSDLDIAAEKLNALDTLLGTATPAGLPEALKVARSKIQAAETLLADAPSSSVTTTTHAYRFGLASSYEADLWGKVRARHKAALLDYEATREDVYAAMLSLSGTVVRQWLVIVAQQQGLDLIHQQLELNKTVLGLIELRYRKGLANALDVFQQRQIVAQTEALIPPLESAVQTARHELAVLLGQPPRSDLGVETALLPDAPPLPEPGLPADLLARRPDVRAAGLDLAAADWRFAAARADRLPSLRLTASATYGADEWALVFDNWVAALAGSLTGPVFDAGRRKAEVERTRAVAGERLAQYQQRVLESVKEVENALVQETKQAEYIAALQREIEAVRATYEQAQQRYRKGLNDYLPVLSALTQLQVLERRLVVARFERLGLRVQLCMALGGAWMNDTLGDAVPIESVTGRAPNAVAETHDSVKKGS